MSKVRESKWERKVNDDSPNLECEVCWAKEPETTIYLYHGASYCADDLERAKEEGWEACDECGAIHDEEDEAMTIKEVGEPIYIGKGGKDNA